jgi:hypothetical protein
MLYLGYIGHGIRVSRRCHRTNRAVILCTAIRHGCFEFCKDLSLIVRVFMADDGPQYTDLLAQLGWASTPGR